VKTKQRETVIAYWLVPAKPEREFFNDVIRILSAQMKAPRFEPHVTIFTASDNHQSPKQVLAQLKVPPIHLGVRGIRASAEFRRTLVVRFGPNRSLERLTRQLRRATQSRDKAHINPHVSLLYKKLPAPTRRRLASMVKLPFSQVVFDSIQAVRCSAPLRDPADIKKWKVVATKSLK
jgi:2'-5' RNA ligase